MCHKKTFEKDKMLQKLSYNFLIAMLTTNIVWLSYSLKVSNMDLVVINSLGTIIATSFVSIYLWVKFKVSRLSTHLTRLLIACTFAAFCSSSLLDAWTTGLVATSLSMT